MSNYKVYFRNDGHGIMVIRLLDAAAPLTEPELRDLERLARLGEKAFAFYNNRLVCEVEYIPQN